LTEAAGDIEAITMTETDGCGSILFVGCAEFGWFWFKMRKAVD
jgi:hypothetical protein